MKSVIIFVLLVAGSHAIHEYHKKADEEFQQLAESSIVFFPDIVVSNEDDMQTIKVSRKMPAGLYFRPEPTNRQLTLHAARGGIYVLSYFRFDFSKRHTLLTLLFDLQTPRPHKLMVTSKVFFLPENSPLQQHAEDHAVFISPLSVEDIQHLMDQPKEDLVKTTTPLNINWIQKILKLTPPLMSKQKRSADVHEYLSPPVIVDEEVLKALFQLCNHIKN